MRKHIAAALAVILALSAFALPSTAYASGTASMEVALTLTEDDVTPPGSTTPPDEPEPSGPDFIINIPASISLNDGVVTEIDGDIAVAYSDISFTWVNYRLEDGDEVELYIDGANTFTDDTFYMTTGDGSTEAQQMPCFLTRSVPGNPAFPANGPYDILVARFSAPSESPVAFGNLHIQTYAGPFYSKKSGTYTGTIHFKIEVSG